LEIAAGAGMVLVATAVIMTPRGQTQATDTGDRTEKHEVTATAASSSVKPVEEVRKADLIDESIQKSKQWAEDIDYRLRFPERRLIDPVEEGIGKTAARSAALAADLADVPDDECPEKKRQSKPKPQPRRPRNSP